MALDTTVGGASADSYVSLVDADAYHLDHGNAAWTGATADKEAALRRGTSWIDGYYRFRFPGKKTGGRSQALEWPRSGAVDHDGISLDSASLPPELLRATSEAALRELTAPGSLNRDYRPSELKTLTQVDVIRWTPVQGESGKSDSRLHVEVVEQALSGIIMRNWSEPAVLVV